MTPANMTPDMPDFFSTYSDVSNNRTDVNSSKSDPITSGKIGERVVQKKQPASPRTERVRTFITKVAELAMWALVAVPGVSQLRHFYAKCCRREMERKETNPVEAQFKAPEMPVITPKCTIEEETKIQAQEMLVSLYKLSCESVKSSCFAQEPMERLQHLADFCERRRQIAAAGLEYQDLDFENNKDLKEFVAIPKVQIFLGVNIELLQKLLDSGKFDKQKSYTLQYMLAVIADLKGLPNSDANAMARFSSENPIRF